MPTKAPVSAPVGRAIPSQTSSEEASVKSDISKIGPGFTFPILWEVIRPVKDGELRPNQSGEMFPVLNPNGDKFWVRPAHGDQGNIEVISFYGCTTRWFKAGEKFVRSVEPRAK
jgi:hypothetical protein